MSLLCVVVEVVNNDEELIRLAFSIFRSSHSRVAIGELKTDCLNGYFLPFITAQYRRRKPRTITHWLSTFSIMNRL